MGYHQDRGALLADLLHAAVALGLEKYVAYGQCLIHDQDLRLHIDGQGKCQTDEHTAGIGLHRLVDKISDIRKIQDFLKLCIHFLLGKAHHGAVHVDIFNSRVVHIETSTQLQKGGDHAIDLHLSRGRRQDSGNDL